MEDRRPEPEILRSAGKAEVLVADLRDAIASGRLRRGERIAPIRSLAARYGASAKAVHSALRRLEGMGLVEMRQGSGTYVCYRPADDGQAGVIEAAQSVALFISDKAHLFDHMSADLVAELQSSGFRSVKFSLDPSRGAEQFERQLDEWRERPPRAVVLQWETPSGDLDDAIRAATRGRARVITAFRGRSRDWHSVDPDNEEAAFLAARRLLERGHEWIGLMTHACGASREPVSQSHECSMGHMDTIRGCVRAVEEPGACEGFSILWDFRGPGESSGLNHEGTLASVAKWLTAPGRPTGVVGDDYRLVTVIKAAERVGLRVPDDVELVGIGNTPWAEAFDFPSVSLREDLAAREIAEIVRLDADGGGETVRHIVVQPQLVLRGTASGKASGRG